MTSSPSPQHEPTMEEILASIRKIISEDQPEAAKPAAPPAPVRTPIAEPAAEAEADVLELTEEVHEEEQQEPEPVLPRSEPAPPLEDDIAFETIEAEPKAEPALDDDDLISNATRNAMGRAFANLDRDVPEFSAPAGGTLEALFLQAVQNAFVPTLDEWVDDHQSQIMDHLKPLIRAWMDEHLPDLIEAAVAKEISRAFAERPRRR